ncbi:MAG: hypothetical protein ACLU6W_13215 [Lachnospiraceae bacterium]
MSQPVRRVDSSAACGLEESSTGGFQNPPEEAYRPWSLLVSQPVRRVGFFGGLRPGRIEKRRFPKSAGRRVLSLEPEGEAAR